VSLAETAFHLKDTALVLRMLETGLMKLDFVMSQHLLQLAELAKRYRNKREVIPTVMPPG
jgi:hypothetical protein